MVKPKEKKKEQSDWTIFILEIFLIVTIGALVATVTTHVIMSRDNNPSDDTYTCISDRTCICNSKNDAIVEVIIPDINYTYQCWVETGDMLKHKFMTPGKNEYEYSILKITSHRQYPQSWTYKDTMFHLRNTELKYDSNIYITPYFDDYIDTMLNLSIDFENQNFKMICEATPNTQNIEYTVWDEGYKETYTLPIRLPHYKIICEVEDVSCKNKCDILNSCHIIFNDGKWLGYEQDFERIANQVIIDTVKKDIEEWHR